MNTNRTLRIVAISISGLALGACASMAEFRELDRKVAAIDRRSQGPTDQQSRVAELGAELPELRSTVAELRGVVEELQHGLAELRERGPDGQRPAGSSSGGSSGPSATGSPLGALGTGAPTSASGSPGGASATFGGPR